MKVRLQEDAPAACWSEQHVFLARADADYMLFHQRRFYETMPGFALLELEEVRDRDQAEALRGQGLYIASSVLPERARDDLRAFVSYRLYDQARCLGSIKDIYYAHSENPLFVLERTEGGECLIPATDHFVRSISHHQRAVYVELPDGLLDLS